jgi:hypothetical protein
MQDRSSIDGGGGYTGQRDALNRGKGIERQEVRRRRGMHMIETGEVSRERGKQRISKTQEGNR